MGPRGARETSGDFGRSGVRRSEEAASNEPRRKTSPPASKKEKKEDEGSEARASVSHRPTPDWSGNR